MKRRRNSSTLKLLKDNTRRQGPRRRGGSRGELFQDRESYRWCGHGPACLSGRNGVEFRAHYYRNEFVANRGSRTHRSVRRHRSSRWAIAATISVPGQPGALKGKVSLVSPALDPNSTTVEVWVQAPNPGDRLKPGSSVQAQMVAQAVQHAIVIPAEALLTGSDGTTSVIVLDTDNKPHKKKVKVGIRDAGDVQVTEGLQGGERVVTVGAFALSQEDDPVLAKTNIQVQAPPNIPEEDDEDQ